MAALMGSIAGRTWSRDERYERFIGRLRALSASADLMFGGELRSITLKEVVEYVLAPFREDAAVFKLEGPEVFVADTDVSGLAMALHELATNAVKYGALSVPTGRVELNWELQADGRSVVLLWKEQGGPEVSPPEREGFGTFLLAKGALPPPHRVDLSYPADGLQARILLVGAASTE